jgi:N-hydroxyarylamine O-acetyltransferase
LTGDGPTQVLQIWSGGVWIDGYERSGIEMRFADRVMASWFTSTHPNSHFRQGPLWSRSFQEGSRLGIYGATFTRRREDGVIESFEIANRDHFQQLLAEHFDLALPEGVRFPRPA